MNKNHSQTYQFSDQKWEALLRISEEAHTSTGIKAFVAVIHEIISDLVYARNFFIALYEERSGMYYFPYFVDEFDQMETTGAGSTYDPTWRSKRYDLSDTLTDLVKSTGKPLRLSDLKNNELYNSGKTRQFGSQSSSWLGVPLKLSGTTIGVMAVQAYDKVGIYSAEDEALMVFVSDHIARAIENVRNEERLRKQHELVLQQQQAITDSISYARRIQKAVLPSSAYISNIHSDYFSLYKPRDILSGDFYWIREIGGYKVFIVADCTGHGIPGALMSMLGVTLLNEQFRTFGIRKPGLILNHLRNKVKEMLAQEGKSRDQKDGMDMAIAILSPDYSTLQYAGANIPLFLTRDKSAGYPIDLRLPLVLEDENHLLFRLKPDTQPIGVHWEEREFETRETNLYHGDSLYMITDGFMDQFGGEGRRKFKARRMKELLLSLQPSDMKEQGKAMEAAFEAWRGRNEQIDDVCVFGLHIDKTNRP
ncbi:MAG: hypothetical protein CSA96_04110 [Bacteroidetes bacterium]|nr:MAG: hypothetical protein CSA96_04110 [Bacteroidota bacterium]